VEANCTSNEVRMGDHDDLPLDLCEKVESLGEGAITQRRLIQRAKLDIDEEEDMQQQRRLHERSYHMDKMDKENEEIRRFMLK
jgi:hypothetical protein